MVKPIDQIVCHTNVQGLLPKRPTHCAQNVNNPIQTSGDRCN